MCNKLNFILAVNDLKIFKALFLNQNSIVLTNLVGRVTNDHKISQMDLIEKVFWTEKKLKLGIRCRKSSAFAQNDWTPVQRPACRPKILRTGGPFWSK